MRWVISVMVNRVLSNNSQPIEPEGFASIWIDIETGEVTAGNIQANAMALFEQVTGGV
jgi:hypothetical protein